MSEWAAWGRQFTRREFWLLFALLSTFGKIVLLAWLLYIIKTGGLYGILPSV
jgi:hypothetical protein